MMVRKVGRGVQGDETTTADSVAVCTALQSSAVCTINKPCCPMYTLRMLPCCLLPTRCPTGGDFSELENSEVVPTVCTTDLLPRLGAAAALLATMLPPLSSSSRQSLQSDTIILLKQSTVTILQLWQGIVTSDNKEEGFSIAEPKCVAALPSICALVRAALCVLPTKKSAVDRMVPDSSVINRCMAVINFASGHLHMQVGVAAHAMYVRACVASVCVCVCQHSSQSTGQPLYRVCSQPNSRALSRRIGLDIIRPACCTPVLLSTLPSTILSTAPAVLQGFHEPCT